MSKNSEKVCLISRLKADFSGRRVATRRARCSVGVKKGSVKDVDSGFCLFELGSTSLKFYYRTSSVGEAGLDGAPIKKSKICWGIGEEVARSGFLSRTSMGMAVTSLRAILSAFVPEHDAGAIVAFATEVFRDAKNREDFLRLVADEVGLQVHILSRGQEAALLQSAFIGKNPSLPAFAFDLGEGSLQWVHARSRRLCQTGSLPVGVFRVFRLFDLIDAWGALTLSDTQRIVDRLLDGLLLDRMPRLESGVATGTGGTARAIAKVLDGTTISRSELEDHVRVNGPPSSLAPHRQPIFLSGIILVNRLLDATGATSLEYRDLSVGKALLLKVLPFYRVRAGSEVGGEKVPGPRELFE